MRLQGAEDGTGLAALLHSGLLLPVVGATMTDDGLEISVERFERDGRLYVRAFSSVRSMVAAFGAEVASVNPPPEHLAMVLDVDDWLVIDPGSPTPIELSVLDALILIDDETALGGIPLRLPTADEERRLGPLVWSVLKCEGAPTASWAVVGDRGSAVAVAVDLDQPASRRPQIRNKTMERVRAEHDVSILVIPFDGDRSLSGRVRSIGLELRPQPSS